jgi:hypothetical protein
VSALGPRGLTVLVIAGIAGALLGIAGWTHRDTGLVAVPPSAAPSVTPSVTSSASPPGAPGSASPAATAGPLLSAEPYASFAYQVWPGPLSADARLAMAGFTLTVTRQATGITVRAVQDGQAMTGASRFYAGGAKVYVIDSNLGDEAGRIDYALADDGLVVTNAQGQVLS